MTFPFLNAISQRPDYIGLLRAQLTIVPLAGSFNTTWTLPPSGGYLLTDLHNQLSDSRSMPRDPARHKPATLSRIISLR